MRVRLSARARTAKGGRVLGLVLIAATFACSPLQRHAVLDFVFDGVPPYQTSEEKALAAIEAAQREAESNIQASRPRQRRIRKLTRFTHGPFAAKECTRCHDLTTASGFRGLSGGGGGERSAVELAEAGRLRMPIDELCVHCHAEFAHDAPGNEGRWLHGPVASGWCVLCHEAHSALYPSLLVAEPTARLCGICHLREDLVETAEHRPIGIDDAYPSPPPADAENSEPEEAATSGASVVRVVRDCTGCHNPHMGPDRLLLRPRNEWADASVAPEKRADVEIPAERDR
jgi:predicted CXXCH cytochrome family protein